MVGPAAAVEVVAAEAVADYPQAGMEMVMEEVVVVADRKEA